MSKSRFEYNQQKVQRGLDYLKEAKQKLNGITNSMKRGISTIQSANGSNCISIDFSYIKSLEEEARSMITNLEGFINEKMNMINEYNAYRNEHPIKSKFADFSMGVTSFVRGFHEGAQSLGDSALAKLGQISGMLGNDLLKECCEEQIIERVTKREEWFAKQYESGIWSDVEKYSSFSSKSTKATVFRGTGSVAPYIIAAIGTGGASSAGSISKMTGLLIDSALAADSTLGERTAAGLVAGEDYDTAYEEGLKSGAIAGALTFGLGKAAEKFTALTGVSKVENIGKTETLLLDKSDDVIRHTSDKIDDFLNGLPKATPELNKTDALLLDKLDDTVTTATKTSTSISDDALKGLEKGASTQADGVAKGAEKVASSQVDDEVVKAAEKKANELFAEKKAALDKKLASGEINKSEYRKALKEIHPDTATYNAKSGNGVENVAKEKASTTNASNVADDTIKNTSKQATNTVDDATKQTANNANKANKAEETFKKSTEKTTNTVDDTSNTATKQTTNAVDDDVINIDDGVDVLTGDANKAAMAEDSVKGHQSIKSKIKNQFNNAKVRDAAYAAEDKISAVKEGISNAGATFKNVGSKVVDNAKSVGATAKSVGSTVIKNPKLAGATVGTTAVLSTLHATNPRVVNRDLAGINLADVSDSATVASAKPASSIFENKTAVADGDDNDNNDTPKTTDDSTVADNGTGTDNGGGNGNGNGNSRYGSEIVSTDAKNDKTKKIIDQITRKDKLKPGNINVDNNTNNNTNTNTVVPNPNNNVNPTTNNTIENKDVSQQPVRPNNTVAPSNTEVVAHQVSNNEGSRTVYAGATTVTGGEGGSSSYSGYSGGGNYDNSSIASATKEVINKTKPSVGNDIGSKVKNIIGQKKINPIVIDDTAPTSGKSGVGLAVGGVVAAGAAIGLGTKAVLDKRKASEEYEDDGDEIEEITKDDSYDTDSAVYDDTKENSDVEMLYDDPYEAEEGQIYDDSYDDIAYGEVEDLVTF